MNLVEAKVEAAIASRLLEKVVYIVENSKEKDDYLLDMSLDRKDFTTFYKNGCEKGEGFHQQANKFEEPKKRKRTVEEIMDDREKRKEAKPQRQPRATQSTELKEVKFDSIEDAVKSTESCIAVIKGKKWIVSVKGSWAIQQSIMDKCEEGLLLVIRGAGYYVYPKSMWNEFESIFKSSTYTNGKPYSQSVLPKKFDKYFKKA